MYDLAKDPHQLKNVESSFDPKVLVSLSTRLVQLAVCSGDTCRAPPGHYHMNYDNASHGSVARPRLNVDQILRLSLDRPNHKAKATLESVQENSLWDSLFTWKHFHWTVAQTVKWVSNLGLILD